MTKKERIADAMRKQNAEAQAALSEAWWTDDIGRAERQLTITQRSRNDEDWIGVNEAGASSVFFASMEDNHATETFLGTDEEDVEQDSIQASYNALERSRQSPQMEGSGGSGGQDMAAAPTTQGPPGTVDDDRGERLCSDTLSHTVAAKKRIRRKASPAPFSERR